MNSSTTEITKGPCSIRCCPFCAAPAHVTWVGLNPLLSGVRCRNCGASIPATHRKCQDAISAWNRRSGLAMLGGKATRGLRSQRKLEAARYNLQKARQVRQLNRLRHEAETGFAALKPYRQQQLAESEAAVAESRAELTILGPKIVKDLIIRRLHALLSKRDVPAALDGQDRCPAHEDVHESQPENSVLFRKHNESEQY